LNSLIFSYMTSFLSLNSYFFLIHVLSFISSFL
jgi:hypothetical protein